MRIAYICQAVDEGDPDLSTTVKWLQTLAAEPQVEKLFVITLRKGRAALPANVFVHVIQEQSRVTRLASFYAKVLNAIRQHIDFFFVHQGGPYPLLLLPFKLLARKPIFEWKAHSYVSPLAKVCLRYCDTKLFTATSQSFPVASAKVRIVGHGIDTARFRPQHVPKDQQLVTVGRISPVKRLDFMLRVVACLRTRLGQPCRLDVYGPTFPRDAQYRRDIARLVSILELDEYVVFHGSLDQRVLPKVLSRSRIFLHYCRGALAKAVLEAMACGVPVVSTNPCFGETLPEGLRRSLYVPRDDVVEQAETIARLLSMSEDARVLLEQSLRDVVVQHHNVESLFKRVLLEIDGFAAPDS